MESISNINGEPVHFEKNMVDVPATGKDANTIYFLINRYNSEGTGYLDDGIYLGDTQVAVGPFNLNLKINNLINMMYPIGKVEIFYDEEDHSSFMGFQWERCLVGRVPVGVDSSDIDFAWVGKVIGEKTHTLQTNEVPQLQPRGVIASVTQSDDDLSSPYYDNNAQPHNNIQPSEVVAFWKRIE